MWSRPQGHALSSPSQLNWGKQNNIGSLAKHDGMGSDFKMTFRSPEIYPGLPGVGWTALGVEKRKVFQYQWEVTSSPANSQQCLDMLQQL